MAQPCQGRKDGALCEAGQEEAREAMGTVRTQGARAETSRLSWQLQLPQGAW